MKTKTNKFLVLLGVAVLSFMGFINNPTQQEEKLIIGTWVCKDDSTLKVKFTDKGRCYWYTIEGTDEYTYSIDREKTPSGLMVSSIKLIGITDPGFNPEYGINGIGKDVLTLETERTQLIFFTRKK